MAFHVREKVALVTGANRGIGRAITEALLAGGVTKVYAAVRDPESAAGLVKAHEGKVAAIPLDVTKPQTIAAAARKAGDVQLVVNNAGILKTATPFDDDAIEKFQQEIDVNVFGLMRVAQAFAPVLKANGGGAFVQLNSVGSLRTFAPFATYCASKAASYAITQALRELLQVQGTQVLSVHPGPIATDMAGQVGFQDVAEPPSLVAEGIVRALAAGDFHLFPGTTARQCGEAYDGFRRQVIEAELAVG